MSAATSAIGQAASVPYLNHEPTPTDTNETLAQLTDSRPISPDSQLASTDVFDSLTSNASDANLSPPSSATSLSADNHDLAQPNSFSPSTLDDNNYLSSNTQENDDNKLETITIYPCSAIHAFERDMPDYDYTPMVLELRKLILDNIEQNPGLYGHKDVLKCKQDDWFLSRFLLRQKMDLNEACEQLKRTMRYHHESLCTLLKPEDFPSEFYQLGGTFNYEPDRRGNVTMYMRVKVHRKTPEIKAVVESFLYYNLLRADEMAKGRGIALVMDCTGGGLQSADVELLFFFVTNLRTYFPKGLSYILVHNLPWILKPFWHLAKNWVSEEHRELIKFSNDRTIFEYIDAENLPDFMGGTCGRNYRQPPENCTNLREAIKFWGIEIKVARSILAKFRPNLPDETVESLERDLDELDELAAAANTTDKLNTNTTPNLMRIRSSQEE